ncbi:MAG: TonB-dependent receptor [Gemmatimonadota bacterium]|jgi:TonB-linked SusC/RagA family outer membrane protein
MSMVSGRVPGRARNRGRERGGGTLGLGVALVALLLAVPANAQQTRVSGTVTSAETGEVLGGVNVTVKNTSIGTLTNSSGNFSLQVPTAQDTLVFSLIGFQEVMEPVDGRSTVSVALDIQAVALQEIVVTGYGTQQRRDVTGSVASVDGSEVGEIATPSVVQSLQGKVAGVQVNAASAEPGSDAIVRIRGIGTLNNTSPLYVVDGMLLDDIGFLAPQDVASVEVLKDASATAIYGSRGANGVIIITTKRGEEQRGTQYRFSAYAGTQSVLDPIDMVTGPEYAQLANELAANQGLPDPYFPGGYNGPTIDWQDEIFESAPIQSYQFSASGGTDRITYYFSANYIDQAGVMPRSDFDRFTLRINNDYALSDAITVGHNLNFSLIDDTRAPNVLNAVYRADPTIAPRDEAGEFNNLSIRSSAGNPAAAVYYTNNEDPGQRLVGNVFGEAAFLDNFTFRTSFGLDYDRSRYRSFVPVFVVSPQQQNQQSDLTVEQDATDSWLWENTLTWNYLTDQHRLTLLGGVTAQSFETEVLGGRRTNVVGDDPSLWYLDAADAEGATNYNSASDWRMLSYLFRANYTFLDRYLFTGSLRVDGSSRFGEDNKYGYFPSVAVGWDLAQESFMEDVDALEALKLRASWGRIGNDKIGAYPSVALVTGNLNYVLNDQLVFGAAPIALANPEVQWEATEQVNLGLDAALFRGRIEATLEWYNRNTDGILVQVPIPNYVGVNSDPFVNAAEVRNRGFEGSLTWFGRLSELGIELSLNGSTVDNEVLALGQGREEIFGGGLVNEIPYTTRTVVGEPIGSFWGYEIEGVFQDQAEIDSSPTRGGEEPGDLRYADLNGDGSITTDDMTFIGSPIPDYIYGIDANFRLGPVDLGVGFTGQVGNEVFNAKKSVRFGVENYEETFMDRWTGPGTSDWEPRITNAGHNYQSSERFIEDGSFLKMHSAQLGYRLPQSVANRMGLDLARVYVSGTNLFLWTDYTGYTPELTASNVIASGLDQGVYPPARVLTIGVDMSF